MPNFIYRAEMANSLSRGFSGGSLLTIIPVFVIFYVLVILRHATEFLRIVHKRRLCEKRVIEKCRIRVYGKENACRFYCHQSGARLRFGRRQFLESV